MDTHIDEHTHTYAYRIKQLYTNYGQLTQSASFIRLFTAH